MYADFNHLLDATGFEPRPSPGIVKLIDRNGELEENPGDEWWLPGIFALRKIAQEARIKSVACIGTGQGIDTILCSHLFSLDNLYATDVVPETLKPSEANLRNNTIPERIPAHLEYLEGRDCEPLHSPVDLITFSPGPLMIEDERALQFGAARAAGTERSIYERYSSGDDDPLLKWSVLPQLAFLQSAMKNLNPEGYVLTLLTGRVPYAAIEECYRRAGFHITDKYQTLKRQTDPWLLQFYKEFEESHLGGDTFDFFDFDDAQQIMLGQGRRMPGIVDGLTDQELKAKLSNAKISACEAYERYLNRREDPEKQHVAHVGYALLARPSYALL